MEQAEPQNVEQNTQRPRVRLFSGLKENWKYVVKASVLILIFWLAQFAYHFYAVTPGDSSSSLIRSFSFSGATLIGLALVIGPLLKLSRHNYIFHRRTLAVWGFTFGIMHFITVQAFIFHFDIGAMLAITNPFVNPVIFGLAAALLFLPLYLTSTDTSLARLGYRRWKRIHALVYPAYILLVLHFMLFTPYGLLNNLSGYLLMLVTAVAIVLQLAGFVKKLASTRSKRDLLIGLIIIIAGLALFYLAYIQIQIPIPVA